MANSTVIGVSLMFLILFVLITFLIVDANALRSKLRQEKILRGSLEQKLSYMAVDPRDLQQLNDRINELEASLEKANTATKSHSAMALRAQGDLKGMGEKLRSLTEQAKAKDADYVNLKSLYDHEKQELQSRCQALSKDADSLATSLTDLKTKSEAMWERSVRTTEMFQELMAFDGYLSDILGGAYQILTQHWSELSDQDKSRYLEQASITFDMKLSADKAESAPMTADSSKSESTSSEILSSESQAAISGTGS
jgi:chromosome segregation ATPase